MCCVMGKRFVCENQVIFLSATLRTVLVLPVHETLYFNSYLERARYGAYTGRGVRQSTAAIKSSKQKFAF